MEDLTKILQKVLNEAHASHTYIRDKEQYGVREHWVVDLEGDCEDFALWIKQKLETEYEIETDLIFCRTEKGGGHLVASVDGWILDNRFSLITPQQFLKYEWVKLGRKGVWYELQN